MVEKLLQNYAYSSRLTFLKINSLKLLSRDHSRVPRNLCSFFITINKITLKKLSKDIFTF